MGGEVANPRRAELRRYIVSAQQVQTAVESALKPAESALDGGAWVSSTVGPFEEGLAQAGRDIRRAAADTVAALEAEWSSEPAMIPKDGPI